MKLSKKDRHFLSETLNQLNEGIAFLQKPEIAVMKETSLTSTDIFTASYYPNKRYASIDKDIGSNLAFIYSAKSRLSRFLESESK